jgi:hypothetical protein
MENSLLQTEWRNGRLPIADAVCFPSGKMMLLSSDLAGGEVPEIRVVGETSIEVFVSAKPGWFAEVDSLCELRLSGVGTFIAGEGSYGSDGFIALTDEHASLIYSAFFAFSNPFIALERGPDPFHISAFSTAQTEWCFDYRRPWEMTVRKADRSDLRRPSLDRG